MIFPRFVFSRGSAILLSCFLLAGCGNAIKTLSAVSRLQGELIKQYREKNVAVNITNDRLTVTFINSPLNDRSSIERANRAQEAAVFVSQHYALINTISQVWVAFVRQQTRFVVLHYSEGLSFFGFDNSGHPLTGSGTGPLAEESNSDARAIATYSSSLKETEVVIRRLQLEGDLDNGLFVTPHFSVSGDATGIGRSTSYPETVKLDFSSSSEKSLFPGEPKITFLTDGKVAYETAAQFSTSKFDETFTEFLSLPVSYPVFRRLTNSRRLTLRIADREYEFTREQVKAMREMTTYVRE